MYSLSLFSDSLSSSDKAKFLNMAYSIYQPSPFLLFCSLHSLKCFPLFLKISPRYYVLFFFWSEIFPRCLLSLSFAWLTPTYCLRFSSVIWPFWIPIVLLAYFLSMHWFIVLSLSMCLWQYRMKDSKDFKLFSSGVST